MLTVDQQYIDMFRGKPQTLNDIANRHIVIIFKAFLVETSSFQNGKELDGYLQN